MLYTSIQYHWTLTCSRIFIVPITLMRSHWDFFLAEFNRAWKWECLFWNEAEILESVLKIKNSDFGRPCRNADLPATAISYEFICSWRNTSTSRTGFFLSQLFTVNEKFNPINERLFNVGHMRQKDFLPKQKRFHFRSCIFYWFTLRSLNFIVALKILFDQTRTGLGNNYLLKVVTVDVLRGILVPAYLLIAAAKSGQ